MTKRIIISLAQENQAVEENEITGAAIDQTKEQEQSSQAGAVVVPLEDSEEEIAAILAVEELSEEIANDQADVERSIEVADGLEDVATIAENIDQPSPTDIALIQTAANMAVAGTDGDATELVPAAESITSGKALAADLRERIAYAHEGIMDTFKGIGEKLGQLGSKIVEKLTSFKTRVAKLRQALNSSEKTKFTLSIKEGDFSVAKGVKIGSVSDFIKAVNQTMTFQSEIANQSTIFSKTYKDNISPIIQNLSHKKNTFFFAEAWTEYFEPVNNGMLAITKVKGSASKITETEGYSTKTVLAAPIGDYAMTVTTLDKKNMNGVKSNEGMGFSDFISAYEKFDLTIEKSPETVKVESAEFEMTKQQIDGLVASIEKMASISSDFVKEMTGASNALTKYLKTITADETGGNGSPTKRVVARAFNINIRLMQGVEKMNDNIARGLLRVAIRAVDGKEEVAQESFNV